MIIRPAISDACTDESASSEAINRKTDFTSESIPGAKTLLGI